MSDREDFFSQLAEFSRFEEAVSDIHHQKAPDSWHVVVTDVRGSTEAIEAGRYRDVNAMGVASIIALQNALPDVDVPYVFGGDGATLLVPGSRVPEMQKALRGLRQVAAEAFSLELRVAHLPVGLLHESGSPFLVARYRLSPHVALAAFAGRGVSLAEEWVKDPSSGDRFSVSAEGPAEADLTGFECRWEPAQSRRGKMVSLLVVATNGDATGGVDEREGTYRSCLGVIDALLGVEGAHPLSDQQMRLKAYGGDYSVEARLASQGPRAPGYKKVERRARRHALAGKALMKMGLSAGGFDGGTYMKEFLENTDFRKFDGALRMVLDLSDESIEALRGHLEMQRELGVLAYGMHVSEAALITCMVKSYGGNHVHFVDGSDGGYALAAKQLKAQLKERGR